MTGREARCEYVPLAAAGEERSGAEAGEEVPSGPRDVCVPNRVESGEEAPLAPQELVPARVWGPHSWCGVVWVSAAALTGNVSKIPMDWQGQGRCTVLDVILARQLRGHFVPVSNYEILPVSVLLPSDHVENASAVAPVLCHTVLHSVQRTSVRRAKRRRPLQRNRDQRLRSCRRSRPHSATAPFRLNPPPTAKGIVSETPPWWRRRV